MFASAELTNLFFYYTTKNALSSTLFNALKIGFCDLFHSFFQKNKVGFSAAQAERPTLFYY